MKDHEISDLVNDLREVVNKYHGTQQLRNRIAQVVSEAITLTSDDDRHISDKLGQVLLRNAEYASEIGRLQKQVSAFERKAESILALLER